MEVSDERALSADYVPNIARPTKLKLRLRFRLNCPAYLHTSPRQR